MGDSTRNIVFQEALAAGGRISPRGPAIRPVGKRNLFHQQNRPGSFDLAGDFAVGAGGHSCHAAGQNFATLCDEAAQEFRIFVIDGL